MSGSRFRIVVLLCASAVGPLGCAARPQGGAAAPRPPLPNVDGARELDQQGVRAYKENRYAAALTFFRESRRLGGPVNEIWNIARCLERLDDGEAAASTIEEYLSTPGPTAEEKDEARRELNALRTRASEVVITSQPSGSPILIDGAVPAAGGATPLFTELPPGSHTVVVHRRGYAAETRKVDAHFGRAIVVSVELAKTGK